MNKHSAELLEEHFDTAFAAPNGVKKLRELILTLAMQGKLVQQDPSDQPARELLLEIEIEKQRLVTEGKIKEPRSLPPVTEEEKPYSLPQGWAWVRLGNIGLINPRNNADDDLLAGFVPMPFIQEGYSGFHSFERRPWGEIKKGYTHFMDGDVGMAKITPCFENAKSCVFFNLPSGIGAGTTELHIFRNAFRAVDPRYVLFFLKNPKFLSETAAKMTGSAGQKRVPTPLFFEFKFPLPPISEQHRIVTKIDELMLRCDELEKLRTAQRRALLVVHAEAIKHLLNIAEPDQYQRAQAFVSENFDELYTVKENVAELRKAILQLAVTGMLVPQNSDDQPAAELLNQIEVVKRRLEEKEGLRTSATSFISQSEKLYGKPEGWAYCRLGNIAKFIDYRGKTPTKVEAGIPLITAKNVRFGYVNREPREYVTLEEYDRWMIRGFPRVGDVLFTTEAPLGNVAIIDIEEKFALAQRVICFQPHMSEIAVWLKNLIMSDLFQESLLLEATGMTATGIKASKLKEMAVPVPPLEEQYRIAAKLVQMAALCDSLDQQIDAATSQQARLLDAIVNTQFHGEIHENFRSASHLKSQVVDLAMYRAAIGCYAIKKLANTPYFGRTAAAKLMYLAQAHIGLELNLRPEREAAGPLDTWIYDFERQGQVECWFEVNEKTLSNGRKKADYRCLPALSEPSAKGETLMSSGQKAEFDRLIYALADKKTEEVEIIATLFAVWNDFLIDGIQPKDEEIISDLRDNWHERKARFSSNELGQWLDWLRKESFIPRGLPPRTVQQARLSLD